MSYDEIHIFSFFQKSVSNERPGNFTFYRGIFKFLYFLKNSREPRFARPHSSLGGIGVVYMRIGKCMETFGGHKGSFIRGLGSVWGP